MPAFHIARRTHPSSSTTELVDFHLDPETLTVTGQAREGVWHYLRLADGTLKPLPAHPQPLAFEPGDVYIALSPSARHVTDSPTLARFLHLHDAFNAEKLAAALLAHLIENAGEEAFIEAVTVLVIEAR